MFVRVKIYCIINLVSPMLNIRQIFTEEGLLWASF